MGLHNTKHCAVQRGGEREGRGRQRSAVVNRLRQSAISHFPSSFVVRLAAVAVAKAKAKASNCWLVVAVVVVVEEVEVVADSISS